MDILNGQMQAKSESGNLPKKISTSGKLLLGITGGVGVGISLVAASFVAPAFRRFCLPYVPATAEQIQNVLSVLPGKQNLGNSQKKLLDIGSGDGRIVFATAKHGLESHGVELNPWLVIYSKIAALKNNSKGTKFYKKDLWKFDIAPYDYIVIFGVEQMMKDLELKLINQAKSSSKVVACRFPLPNLTPLKTIDSGVNTVWLYEIKK